MAAFVGGGLPVTGRARVASRATCARKNAVVSMGYDMDGTASGSLEQMGVKSSGVSGDRRSFRVTFCLPSESRLYTFRELQNVYTTKLVPFSSWYAEQQRIQKMGGKILKVELASGTAERSVGNT